MKRKLFTLLAAISLLLCVATVVLWVRGHSRRDYFTLRRSGSEMCRVMSVQNGIQWIKMTNTGPDAYETGWTTDEPAFPLVDGNKLGFGAYAGTVPTWDGNGPRQVGLKVLLVPSYSVVGLLMILPFIQVSLWWRDRLRRRRAEAAE